jgi:hypothetical protein
MGRKPRCRRALRFSVLPRISSMMIGYKGASVDRIMKALKLTKGSFYHHIEAKDDLILECFRDSYRRLAHISGTDRRVGGNEMGAPRIGCRLGSLSAIFK